MKDEALRLALEALEGVLDDSPKVLDASISGGLYEVVQCRDAITAIKAALEAKDEPVGWAEHGVINWLADKQFKHTSFLYAIPPQRTWVGLTDEEAAECWTYNDRTSWKNIEAKLKEKNT